MDHAGIFVDAPSKDLTDARNGENGEEFSLNDDSIVRLIKLGCDAKMFVLPTGAYEKLSGMIFEYDHMVSHAIAVVCCLWHVVLQCHGAVLAHHVLGELKMMPLRTEELSDFTAATPFNSFITRFRATVLVHMRSEQR